MADNLALEHLRHIRNRVDQLGEDMSEVKHRLTSLERGQAKGLREYADLHGDQAYHNGRIDRLSERIERVEHRLELKDGDPSD